MVVQRYCMLILIWIRSMVQEEIYNLAGDLPLGRGMAELWIETIIRRKSQYGKADEIFVRQTFCLHELIFNVHKSFYSGEVVVSNRVEKQAAAVVVSRYEARGVVAVLSRSKGRDVTRIAERRSADRRGLQRRSSCRIANIILSHTRVLPTQNQVCDCRFKIRSATRARDPTHDVSKGQEAVGRFGAARQAGFDAE